MRIALCNKSKPYLEKLKYAIYSYLEQHKIDAVVDCYFYGEEILASKIKYNIIFIEYSLPGKNGLQIIKELRETDSKCAVIFTSANTNFVLDTFSVNPQAFLINPVKKGEIFRVLDDYFTKKGTDYPLFLKSEGDTICLNTSEILYLEAENKYCRVHIEGKSLKCNRTMARVYENLPQNHFLKINRSCVVNSVYVHKYNRDTIILRNGETLYVSRKYYSNFKKDYRDFINPRQP